MPNDHPERRADDQVDDNGEPLSPAHRALAAEISVVRVDLEQHIAEVHELPAEIADRLHGDIHTEVKRTLARGDFELPDGRRPGQLLEEHSFLTDGQARLEERQGQIAHQIDLLADEVIGPCRERFDGGVERDKTQGVIAKVDDIDRRLTVGVSTRLRPQDRAAIWIAAITAGGAVVASAVAIIGHL